MQYCYICCALPQRSRLSIDRLSSVPPPPACLPACLPSFMSRCNLFFGPAALTAAFPDAASRPALRADTEMRKDQGHLPVMNPRPHLALSFAHRRRLPLHIPTSVSRSCRTAKLARPAPVSHTAPCQCPSRSNVRRGYRRRSLRFIVISSRLLLSTNSKYRHCSCRPRELPVDQRCNPPFVLENDIPCCSLAHSDSLPIASIPYSCATSPAPATCQPCALTQAT